MNETLIKQNINFLENPLWLPNLKQNSVWGGYDGYIYRTGKLAPDKTDSLFLYCWLQESQLNNWKKDIELTKYEILKRCNMSACARNYDRIIESLFRWHNLSIGFKGRWYNGKDYNSKIFGVIDNISEEKGKPLKITFNSNFLYEIQNSDFCKYINFEELKELRNPTASRLHEILSKTFKGRNEWAIDAHKLANKIPIQEKYLTHIIAKIQPAVKRITQKTNLHLDLEIRKKERGKAVLVFRRTNEQAEITKTQNIPEQQLSLSEWANSPENRMKTIGKSDSEIRAMMKKTK